MNTGHLCLLAGSRWPNLKFDLGFDVLLQASFVASGNRTDISLDDPNFWDKWAKKADIDMEMVNGRVSVATENSTVI